ncbi:MAG: hypothetical protein CVV34_07920, partial [Methanomicrobiales archaeon HGW-Methanomicrobiales-5]
MVVLFQVPHGTDDRAGATVRPGAVQNPIKGGRLQLINRKQIRYENLPIMVTPPKPVPAARPFLKWAGGKTQLLNECNKRLPEELQGTKITRYVEPFIGGGAVFFSLNQRFAFEQSYICDANEELILAYRVIQKSVKKLISELEILKSDYFSRSEEEKEKFYYEVRDAFNRKLPETDFHKYHTGWIERTAQIIFLNRTCFNGLFRVNRKGEFNVPFGRYKMPDILNEENLRDVAKVLKRTEILFGDFTTCREFVDDHTFVYFDPPYRPLN